MKIYDIQLWSGAVLLNIRNTNITQDIHKRDDIFINYGLYPVESV